MITHWAGDAYSKLISPEYDAFRWRLFEKTGCLVTADGSDGDKITPEGLPNYKIPPPAIFVEAGAGLPISNVVEPVNDDQPDNCSEHEDEDEPSESDFTDNEAMFEDMECDRC